MYICIYCVFICFPFVRLPFAQTECIRELVRIELELWIFSHRINLFTYIWQIQHTYYIWICMTKSYSICIISTKIEILFDFMAWILLQSHQTCMYISCNMPFITNSIEWCEIRNSNPTRKIFPSFCFKYLIKIKLNVSNVTKFGVEARVLHTHYIQSVV